MMNPYETPKAQAYGKDLAVADKVTMHCAECGGTNLTRVKPKEFVAFTKDYQCVQCRYQFPASIPIWVALLFIILGLPLACLGVLSIYVNFDLGRPIPLAIGAGILFMGAKVFWKGLTSFGKQE